MKLFSTEKNRKLGIFFLLIGILIIGISAQKTNTNEENQLDSVYFKHNLNLNYNEYAILNATFIAGLTKYGGQIDYTVEMSNQGNQIIWDIEIDNKKQMKILTGLLQERAIEWTNSISEGGYNENSKAAMETLKNLQDKVSFAQKNPATNFVQLNGLVLQVGKDWYLQEKGKKYQIIGPILDKIVNMEGKAIIGKGVLNNKAQFQMFSSLEKRENTLELFVMSLCPFGQRAVGGLINYLDDLPIDTRPKLDIRYIFYPSEGDSTGFTTLHGAEETKENLVQMIIRDRYANYFYDYLLRRNEDAESTWKKIAQELGMDKEAIDSITVSLIKDKQQLIEQEFAYVFGLHQIDDGSPSYVWESEKVEDIRKMETFAKLTFPTAPAESCSN